MTTRSPATHELSRPLPSLDSAKRNDAAIRKEERPLTWSERLQRAREILRGVTHLGSASTSAPSAPPDTPENPGPGALAPELGSLQPKSQREDDRTTRIYQRPALESAAAALFASEPEEVSTTSRLPSEDLAVLLSQVYSEAAADSSGALRQEEPDAQMEIEVSSITFEELEEFRRSLVDRLAQSTDSQPAPPAPSSAAAVALSVRQGSLQTLRAAKGFLVHVARRSRALLLLGAFRLVDLGVAVTERARALRGRVRRVAPPSAKSPTDGPNPS